MINKKSGVFKRPKGNKLPGLVNCMSRPIKQCRYIKTRTYPPAKVTVVSGTFIFELDSGVWDNTLPILTGGDSFKELSYTAVENAGITTVTVNFTFKGKEVTNDGVKFNGVVNYATHPSVVVTQWGGIPLTRLGYHFGGFQGSFSATDAPTILTNTSFRESFDSVPGATYNLDNWDTTNVTNMRATFYGTPAFNEDIGGWNTSNVTTMQSMFAFTGAFNQDIGDWDTSKVTTLENTFYNAAVFNNNTQPLSWKTYNVTTLRSTFNSAVNFQGRGLETWNTSNVESLKFTFFGTNILKTTCDLTNWDTSKVTDMEATFFNTQDVSGIEYWNTSNVTTLEATFYGSAIDNDIDTSGNAWNTSKVTTLFLTFAFESSTEM